MAAEFIPTFVAAIKFRSRCGRVNYNSAAFAKARIFSCLTKADETTK
jgi:hypothetical protein